LTEGNRKKVLIFDDEQIIGDIACQMLDFYGCDGVHVTTVSETVQIYKFHMENGEPFDAVIMDLNVSAGAGGKEAVKDVLELDGQAKVYVSSGDSNDSAMLSPSDYGFAGTICKPFDLQVIEEFVNKLIK